jgi:hypothetical protein
MAQFSEHKASYDDMGQCMTLRSKTAPLDRNTAMQVMAALVSGVSAARSKVRVHIYTHVWDECTICVGFFSKMVFHPLLCKVQGILLHNISNKPIANRPGSYIIVCVQFITQI